MERIVVLAFIVFIGCSDVGEQYVAPPPDILLNQLLAFPETTIVSGRTLYLTTSMYRDFMPISPPDGKPLGGGVYITATDTSALNNVISSDAIWIVFGQEIWKSWLKDSPGGNRKNQLVKYFRDGLKWGPHVFVDVVVRLKDNQGNIYFLRASKQWIGRTD